MIFNRLVEILEFRQQYASSKLIKKTCYDSIKHSTPTSIIDRVKIVFSVVDRLLFNGEFLKALSPYDMQIFTHNMRCDSMQCRFSDTQVHTQFRFDEKRIVIHFLHEDYCQFFEPSTSTADAIECCIRAVLHETTHLIEFLVRVELQTRLGYHHNDDKNILFTNWEKILFHNSD